MWSEIGPQFTLACKMPGEIVVASKRGALKDLSVECGFTADQVNQLIFTQISKPSIAKAAERCNVPVEKCHTIMQKWGYTGTACIPMALDDAIELGKIKRGDLVVMISSGLGWNQAAAAIRMAI
jgi:3-oxoacyl-[acyl-carrier-protein] synthase III